MLEVVKLDSASFITLLEGPLAAAAAQAQRSIYHCLSKLIHNRNSNSMCNGNK
jgi:hypothetical protein